MRLETALLKINHTKGRRSKHPIDVIVIHVTEGSAAGVRSWFKNPRAKVSAHYMVQRDGAIVQFVREEDTAWHAGRIHRASAAIVKERAGSNPNGWSVGIEHEGTGKDELTGAQRVASVYLIRDIAKRYSIPLDRRHIIGHREIFKSKTCPGAISVDRLVREAAQPEADTPAPRIVFSPNLDDYLVVTDVKSDTDWRFVPMKKLPKSMAASTPLSKMPTKRP